MATGWNGAMILIYFVMTLSLAVGTIVWLGLRATPTWAPPRCRRCAYDLRGALPSDTPVCPECGADLTAARAVAFVRGRPRWGLVVWAALVLLMPAVGMGGMVAVSSAVTRAAAAARGGPTAAGGPAPVPVRQLQPQELRALPIAELVETHLPRQANNPWVWDVLGARLRAGELSADQVGAALRALAAHLRAEAATRPDGRLDRPLHWSGEFVKAAHASGLASDAVLIELAEAYHGTEPVLEPFDRLREGPGELDMTVQMGTSWNDVPLTLLWQVDRVLLDGQPVEYRQVFRHGNRWRGSLRERPGVGEHTVTVEATYALIDAALVRGVNPGTIPPGSISSPKKRARTTASAPLRVYTRDEPIVELFAEAALADMVRQSLAVERVVVLPGEDGGQRLEVPVEFRHPLPVAMAFDVSVEVDTEAGRRTFAARGRWSYTREDGGSHTGRSPTGPGEPGDGFPRGVERATVVLTPNPRLVEPQPEVDRIWGEQIRLDGVPIERLVEAAARPGAGAGGQP